jgi:hypothetical protein
MKNDAIDFRICFDFVPNKTNDTKELENAVINLNA